MKIHEFQGKDLFRQYGIPTPPGEAVKTPAHAMRAASIMGMPVVLKAQVHVGGRGKAGGVKVVEKITDVEKVAKQIHDLTIKGLPVKQLLVTPAAEIAKEVYLGILIDRGARACSSVEAASRRSHRETNAGKILPQFPPPNRNGAASGLPRVRLETVQRRGPGRAGADIMAKMAKLFAKKTARCRDQSADRR